MVCVCVWGGCWFGMAGIMLAMCEALYRCDKGWWCTILCKGCVERHCASRWCKTLAEEGRLHRIREGLCCVMLLHSGMGRYGSAEERRATQWAQ